MMLTCLDDFSCSANPYVGSAHGPMDSEIENLIISLFLTYDLISKTLRMKLMRSFIGLLEWSGFVHQVKSAANDACNQFDIIVTTDNDISLVSRE